MIYKKLSVKEYAQLENMSTKTVYTRIYRNQLKSTKVGKKTLVLIPEDYYNNKLATIKPDVVEKIVKVEVPVHSDYSEDVEELIFEKDAEIERLQRKITFLQTEINGLKKVMRQDSTAPEGTMLHKDIFNVDTASQVTKIQKDDKPNDIFGTENKSIFGRIKKKIL